MKPTRSIVLASTAALALALSGCGGSTGDSSAGASGSASASAQSDSDCASEDVFCVGLVTDFGNVDDKSFNQSAYEALQSAESDGAVINYTQTVDSKDWAANIKRYTDRQYDVVVTVGFDLGEATAAAAKAVPETSFIGVDQAQTATIDNYAGLIFPEDQAGYAAGYLGGLLTTSNKLGQVLGKQIPPVEKFAKGFEAGAKASNPQAQVTTVYHAPDNNAFIDPVWGGQEAKKQLAQGADVIFGAGGKTGNGALAEVAKAPAAGDTTFCVGVDSDQWETVPEARPCLVTSAMKLITPGVEELISQAKDGSMKGGNFEGDVGLADYHELAGKVPDDVQTKVEDTVEGLQDGSIATGVNVG